MSQSLRTRSSALVSCGAATLLALSALVVWGQTSLGLAQATEEPAHSAALDDAIVAAAKRHGVPESLLRRIIMRESKYNPLARNRKFWGLMQISYPTAKSMGFKGSPHDLLDPVVNLRYAVPYLANAFVVAGKREEAAVRLYAAGYYNTARTRGLLGDLRTADSAPLSGVEQYEPVRSANAVAQPPESIGIFGALFGPGSSLQPQPQTQPVATAAAVAPEPSATAAAAAPAGTFDGPKAVMVAGKGGSLAPPKKWTRDGGTSVIARGEQTLDQIASREKTADEPSRKSRRHTRKLTAFAALDLPASNAQAYAASAAQDPRFAAAPSQTAIAQATSPNTSTDQPIAEPRSRPQEAAVAADQNADEAEKPVKRSRSHQARKRKAKEAKEARAEKRGTQPATADSAPPPTAQQ